MTPLPNDVPIGGAGFPRPDGPPRMPGGGVDLSRGVDLSIIRDKRKHQHRWILVGNYLIDEKGMATLAEASLNAQRSAQDGEAPEQIQIPYSQDTMVGMEGPGCAKCGIIWNDSNKGYGKLCDVSDDEYDPQSVVTPPPGALKIPPNFTWEMTANLLHQGISNMAPWVLSDEGPREFMRQLYAAIGEVLQQYENVVTAVNDLGSEPGQGDPLEAMMSDGDDD